MAPRTQAKVRGAFTKVYRQPTQFGELDTTPTSHHALPIDDSITTTHRDAVDNLIEASASDSAGSSYLNGTDPPNFEFSLSNNFTDSTTFPWSEAGSLTRRSSPIRPGETPKSIWQFSDEDSLTPPSTMKIHKNQLPDTMPLPTQSHPFPYSPSVMEAGADVHQSPPASKDAAKEEAVQYIMVDSPATASTIHQSSDTENGNEPKIDIGSGNSNGPGTEIASGLKGWPTRGPRPPPSLLSTIPVYGKKVTDLVPLPPPGQSRFSPKAKSEHDTGNGKRLSSPGKVNEKPKAKRVRQIAKPPIQLDETTEQMPMRPAHRATSPRQLMAKSGSSAAGKRAKRSIAKKAAKERAREERKEADKEADTEKKGRSEATPAAKSANGDQDAEQCLAPSKPSTKGESDVEQKKTAPTPCVRKEAATGVNDDGHKDIVVIPSNNGEQLSLEDCPFSSPTIPGPSLKKKKRGKRWSKSQRKRANHQSSVPASHIGDDDDWLSEGAKDSHFMFDQCSRGVQRKLFVENPDWESLSERKSNAGKGAFARMLDEEAKAKEKGKEKETQSGNGAGDANQNLGDRLHVVIDDFTEDLARRERDVEDIGQRYPNGCCKAIKRILSRHDREIAALKPAWGQSFKKTFEIVGQAQATVESGRSQREAEMKELCEGTKKLFKSS